MDELFKDRPAADTPRLETQEEYQQRSGFQKDGSIGFPRELEPHETPEYYMTPSPPQDHNF